MDEEIRPRRPRTFEEIGGEIYNRAFNRSFKPRVYRIFGGSVVELWCCKSSDGIWGYGQTPAAAYRSWKRWWDNVGITSLMRGSSDVPSDRSPPTEGIGTD